MLKNFLHIVFIAALTLAHLFSAFAQEKPDIQTVKSADGLVLVRNDKVQRFSFFVPGKNPSDKQMEDGSIQIATDDGGLYAYFFKTAEFLEGENITDQGKILEAHRDRDLAAEEQAWQAKLNAAKGFDLVKIKDLPNPTFPGKLISSLSWSYSPPGSDGTVLHQSILLGDTVLMLRTVFPPTVKIEEVRAFFKKVLESVALLPAPKTPAAPKKQPRQPGKRKN